MIEEKITEMVNELLSNDSYKRNWELNKEIEPFKNEVEEYYDVLEDLWNSLEPLDCEREAMGSFRFFWNDDYTGIVIHVRKEIEEGYHYNEDAGGFPQSFGIAHVGDFTIEFNCPTPVI